MLMNSFMTKRLNLAGMILEDSSETPNFLKEIDCSN